MCDYCDCRSIPEIAALSLDHERVMSIVAQLRHLIATQATQRRREEIDRLLDALQADLELHTRREEVGVYSVFREVGLDFDYPKRFVDDHADIRALLARALGDTAVVGELLERLDRHVLEEESDVFPAARQLFSGADWAEVERRLVVARCVAIPPG